MVENERIHRLGVHKQGSDFTGVGHGVAGEVFDQAWITLTSPASPKRI